MTFDQMYNELVSLRLEPPSWQADVALYLISPIPLPLPH